MFESVLKTSLTNSQAELYFLKRKRMGYSLRKVAVGAYMSVSSVCNIEAGLEVREESVYRYTDYIDEEYERKNFKKITL